MAKATGKDITETKQVNIVFLNNSALSTESRPVNLVVINDKVVPDPKEINPGVIINAQQTK